jgi:hypothetical protein
MNVDLIREIVKEKDIYVKENDKNIFCKCVFCQEHKTISKQDHLRISKNPELPIYHCFLCNKSNSIRELIYYLTHSDEIAEQVLPKSELKQLSDNLKIIKSKQLKFKDIKIPELEPDLDSFPSKLEYIKNRLCTENIDNYTFNLLKNNLIFNIRELINLNPGILFNEKTSLINKLQEQFVGFISHNKSKIFFRNINRNDNFKFFKYEIQNNNYNLLDYVSFKTNNTKSNTIVLSEGIFNILACITHNILNLNNESYLFASCQSFSYESALKSICFDESLYKVNVVILSDLDKEFYCYNKFINNTQHIVENLKLYYNKNKKDFGTFPICPILYDHKIKKAYYNENNRMRQGVKKG